MESLVKQRVTSFFRQYPRREFAKDQMIVFGHENPSHIIHLEVGRVRQYDITVRGDEIILNTFKPPAFFPMNWALNHTPNRYFFQAEEDCVVRVAPPADVAMFLRHHPEVMLDSLQRLYRGVDGLLGRLVQLMGGSALSRVSYELLIECRRFGTQLPGGSWQILISEQALASQAGLTRETVCRTLQYLKDARVVALARGTVTIPDIERLESFIEQ